MFEVKSPSWTWKADLTFLGPHQRAPRRIRPRCQDVWNRKFLPTYYPRPRLDHPKIKNGTMTKDDLFIREDFVRSI